MLVLQIFLMVLGFVLLVKGADWFVDGSAGVAKKCKISPLVIGLTVVAFGTSMPELAVSITSAVQHSTDISIGNVVGSNITNILLILGLSSLFHNLPVDKNSRILDLPVMLGASLLLILFGTLGGNIVWWEGLLLLFVFALYLAFLFWNAKREQKKKSLLPAPPKEEKEEEPPKGKIAAWFARMEEKLWFLLILLAVGLGMVVGGGILLVNAAQYIAEQLGVSERVIGLTVVAIGTSLPELVTSVVAAAKGETEIAVGNVIGSNIFNILLVAGTASLFYPLTFTLEGNLVDALVALGAALLLFGLSFFKKHELNRITGGVMLACFVGYYVYLFLA